jgi:energy-coupling factor transport system permease protein
MNSIDPRVKLTIFFELFVLSFILKNIYAICILTIVCLAISALSGVSKKVIKRLIFFIPMLVVAFLLWTSFSRFSMLYVFKSESLSLSTGIFMTLRLFLILTISITFIFTTTPEEMIRGLNALHFPKGLVFLFGLSLREVDVVSREFISIREAQASRGLELDKGSLIKRVKNHIPILIPLLVRSIEGAEKLVLAMELKAFSLDEKKRYAKLKLSKIDLLVLFFIISLGSVMIIFLR